MTRTTLYSFLRAIGRNTCGASLFDKSIDKQLVPDSRLGSYYSSYRAKFIHSRINRPSSSFPRSFGIIQDWKSIIQSYEIFLMDYDLSYPFVKDTSGNSFARLHYAFINNRIRFFAEKHFSFPPPFIFTSINSSSFCAKNTDLIVGDKRIYCPAWETFINASYYLLSLSLSISPFLQQCDAVRPREKEREICGRGRNFSSPAS